MLVFWTVIVKTGFVKAELGGASGEVGAVVAEQKETVDVTFEVFAALSAELVVRCALVDLKLAAIDVELVVPVNGRFTAFGGVVELATIKNNKM